MDIMDINILLLCLILAVFVVQDSLILKIFLRSCKPQDTWHQTGKSRYREEQ